MYDQGHVPTPEPYQKRTNGGILLGPDGSKMSKSKGNVINPKEKLDEVGADALRFYMAFIGPYEATTAWQDGGLKACKKLVDTIFKLSKKVSKDLEVSEKLESQFQAYLVELTGLIESLKNNVAVAKIMTFSNHLKDQEAIPADIWLRFLQTIAPFAVFTSEELWYEYHGYDSTDSSKTIHKTSWPEIKPELIKTETVTIVVQVNGKLRARFEVAAGLDDNTLLESAKEEVGKWLEGKQIKFTKVIPDKMVTIAVK